MLKKILYSSALCLFVLATAGVAKADTIYTLNQDGCSGGCGTGPYGSVDLSQNGSNVDVTVTLASGYSFITTGALQAPPDGAFFAFNLSGTSLYPTISNLNSAYAASNGSTKNGGAFGTFDDYILCPKCKTGGGSPIATSLTFTIDGVMIADFVNNGDGYIFAADVIGPNGNTGLVANGGSTPPVVPEPPTLLLLGTGLAVLAGMMKLKAIA